MIKLKDLCDKVLNTDLLIIGSEGAGGHAAIEASKSSINMLIVTKGKIGQCGASQMAGADFNVDGLAGKELGFEGDDRDTPDLFFETLVREGLYLGNQKVLEKYVEYAPKAMKDLIDWGMKIYSYESAHTEEMARGIISSGILWVAAIRKKVKDLKIPILEDTMVVDILTSEDKIAGAIALNIVSGEIIVIACKAIIMATGGWHKAYPFNTGPEDLTGDGVAMAYRAGAELVSMEMIQFCPITMVWPPKDRGSIILYIISEIDPFGKTIKLLNNQSERFMETYDPINLEQSTKEIVSIASQLEIEEGRGGTHGGIFFSLKHTRRRFMDMLIKVANHRIKNEMKDTRYEFTTLLPELLEKMKTEDIEVGNGAHYMGGGIKINENMETSLPGLYAAGECSGGMWGAVRVASACTEAGVQGKIAGEMAPIYVESTIQADIDITQVKEILNRMNAPLLREHGITPNTLQKKMHEISGKKVGLIKNGKNLEEAVAEFEKLLSEDLEKLYISSSKSKALNFEYLKTIELRNMLTCLYLSAKASLMREESRGEFYRKDYTVTDNDNWLKTIVIKRKDGDNEIRFENPIITKISLPKGKLTYQEAIGVATVSLKRD
ncbi:MAG: FAD-binding protein [Promethearchaeota archaeon]|nr:MAG: FAD-binding protein [Candidatus Lokiarchaeota archaeon]